MEPIIKHLNYILYMDNEAKEIIYGTIPFRYTGEKSLLAANLIQMIAFSDPNYNLAYRGTYYISPEDISGFGSTHPHEFEVKKYI